MLYMSPGVYTREIDLSTIVPAISTTTSAAVGYSAKGSLDITLVTNRQQFVQEYGEPTPGNWFHYTALAFLEHGTQLYCRRVENGALYGGMHVVKTGVGDNNSGFSVGQSTPVFYNDSNVSDELFSIVNKDPGEWGNNISCIIKNVKDGGEDEVTEQYTFEIDVYFTDVEGTTSKVETFKVSRRANKIDGYGKQMNLEEKINRYSKYIKVADNTGEAETELPKENAVAVTFQGGSDGSTVTTSDIIGNESAETGWQGFRNTDNTDVRILIGGGFVSSFSDSEIATVQTAIIAVAEARKDCIAVLDVPYSELTTNTEILEYRNVTLNANSSYAAIYAGYVVMNDAYNDRILEVPPSGYAAAQYAYNDAVGEVWMAPAGENRGRLNVLSISRVFNQGDRDALYTAGVNPMQVFRGGGNVIWGQKTLQAKSSALDRVNVRRLLITMEKAMSISLRGYCFETNTDLTRFRVSGMLTEYCDKLSSRGAFQTELGDNGYLVVCDEDNNQPAIIDDNQMNVDVFVKPVRSAEAIQLTVIATRTGASFEELMARGVLL